MHVHIKNSFKESYDAAYKHYAADWDVKPAIIHLSRAIIDSTQWLNRERPLDDMSDATVEAARLKPRSFLDGFMDRTGTPRAIETAAFLRGIRASRPLAGLPTIGDRDADSRIYVWHPTSKKYRMFARSVGVYLHHPVEARVLLHVWIGAHHDLEDCLAQFERPDFAWTHLWSDYGEWLAEEARK